MRIALAFVCGLLCARAAFADGPVDNIPEKVRRIPALGIEVPAAVQAELSVSLGQLRSAIDALRAKNDARTRELLPDVEIYRRAVSDALEYREFFTEKELDAARSLLVEGLERAKRLAAGEAPWTTQTGLVVRGYVSRIDGSVQPYGLVVPPSFRPDSGTRHRLDLWFHGRGENLSEVNFLNGRRNDRGVFTPPDTIVLHPYGRYSNAFKFAGEADVLEAMESVKQRYPIDEERIAVRGFSMGGAACWQFAVHYADRWVGATPGAGFSETPEFLRVFQKETLTPTWYERKLWRLYDCTDYAVNLWHCPTVAYSGEIDSQKQAADVMAEALQREGIDLVHLIGPKTGHSYHPEARAEIDRRLNSIAERGRDRLPKSVHFTTYTLKYNRMHWVTLDALGEHWERARVDAEVADDHTVRVKTANVRALTLAMPSGWCPLDARQPVTIQIDGQKVAGPRPASDRSWNCPLSKSGDTWKAAALPGDTVRKQHDLQGPIDDAFMDGFVFVRPTSKSPSPAFETWMKGELDHAVEHWRRHFRGSARIKDDTAVTDDDIASLNLVLWGDPESNAVLKKIAERLPIQWTRGEIVAGERKFPTENHALLMICPNPLNPRKYVVLNSSFTYREYDYLNNARQVPKLPDWAVIDLRTPANSRYPGKVVAADFFGEQWELRPPRAE